MQATLFDPACRARTIARLRSLAPDAPRRWGTMSAPRMVAHLFDQMTHCLGEAPCRPMASPLRLPGLKWLAIHVVPWPRGRIQGPPDAFRTPPGDWAADLERLVERVERFAARGPGGRWPDHAKFGPMSGADWGYFCAKHFDHHLRQFGA
jgi:hypothetical protein